jgi:hypothetical protein
MPEMPRGATFDDPAWFEPLLETLPTGHVFDGEIVALDDAGRPMFNDLLFHLRPAVYVPFDVLFADGEDVRGALLKERRAILPKVVQRYGLQRCEPVLGERAGRAWNYSAAIEQAPPPAQIMYPLGLVLPLLRWSSEKWAFQQPGYQIRPEFDC